MPHQDPGRSISAPAVRTALDWLSTPGMFVGLSFRRECRWNPERLVQATLLWAWSEETSLVDRFFVAQQVIAPRGGEQRESVSYQAFVKLLRRHTARLLIMLVAALQRQMEEHFSETDRAGGYAAFGVDGTRIDVPRTAANERAFGAARCRTRRRGRRRKADWKKATGPRISLTTLWHLESGLPWSWRRSSASTGERAHALEMLPQLPAASLIVADAGFVGYDFWQALREAGHDFVIRVGANVTLLKRLGYYRECDRRVYLWPDRAAQRRQPPLALRLTVAHDGKRPVYLVTSVLSSQALSDRRLLELYRARWGVEVFYRSFKRSFGRHKLRSASPENAQLELDWSLAALWAACLYAKCQQQEAGQEPTRTSVAGVLRILRRAAHDGQLDVAELLARAIIDPYQRADKASRNYPRKKNEPPPAAPKILKADKNQRRLANELKG